MTAVVEQTSTPSTQAEESVGRAFLRRAVEAYFRRWPFYLALLLLALTLGVLSLRQIGRQYTSNGTLFVEPRTLIESQSADEYEGYLARFTGAGFVIQDLKGLIRTEAFMSSVAENAGYELSENPAFRSELLFALRFSFDTDIVSDHLVWIGATSSDPEDAQALASSLIDNYIDFQISSATAESIVAEEFFDGVIETASVELREARAAVDEYASRVTSVRTLGPAEQVEFDELREREVEASARFRAAVDGSEAARLIRARVDTLVRQRYAFVNQPELPVAPDEAGFDGFMRLLAFALVGVSLTLVAPVVSAARGRTVLLPEDLEAEFDVPVLAQVPAVAARRLAVDRPGVQTDGGGRDVASP